ncbi:LRR receptor-like serine/threonine-protein kinase GSO1 [Papaver somniferum]|uniref:LRR receptor-like serine/threonine-protein kinase GSO1 n=1 Tax=Papaver somniferum TaxID=3469 RepID=UPI000E7053D6|nr:LRR receptor-like serine/threonine-protein kinase GSO1 [Papaver somniferum]
MNSLFLQFLLFLLINITHCPLACHEQERRALLDFKFSLEDPANRLSSWLDDNKYRNCCDWQGVGCSSDSSHVISINLRNTDLETFYNELLIDFDLYDVPPPNTALQGKFSSSFVNLSHLEYVDLAFNNFEESKIPFLFYALTKLVHLDLSHSNFSSPVSTPLSNLSSLRYLDLSCGSIASDERYFVATGSCFELSSIKWLRGSVNLNVLRLRGIDLHEAASSEKNFAESISYLSNLRILDLSDCNLPSTVFPTHEFYNLSRLSSLTLSENYGLNFHIPVQLLNLTSLSILDLNDCGLQGSVPYLPQLTKFDVSHNYDLRPDLTRMFQQKWPKLQRLSISDTNAIGSIPDSISNAPLLVDFDASFCRFEGSLPSSFYNLSQFQSLDLSLNSITGYIHSSISNLKSLRTLVLPGNNLQGSIPESISNLKSLRTLVLGGNSLQGSIPESISNLKFLRTIELSGNNLQGSIPVSISNLKFLRTLDLSGNNLQGSIPKSISNLTFLRTLYLSGNNLQGSIPKSMYSLRFLDLRSNNITGFIPKSICKMSSLMSLDLSHNHLTGIIPTCFSKLNFSTFDLSNNKLHGRLPLPPNVVGISSSFDVSYNKITGEISTEYGKRLSSFYYINLAGNELSSSIPFSICSRDSESNPEFINLSNNKLFGVIPTSIGYSRNLRSLNLGNNNLTGNVPNELQQLKSLSYLQLNDNILDGTPLSFISKLLELQVLNLANNHFEGSIPSAFGSAIGLSILSLRSNKFNGSIPQEFSHLVKLQILDLSGNNLNGLIPRKIGNLMMLRSRPNDVSFLVDIYDIDVQLQMVIKGIMIQFKKLYAYSSGIDLSCNDLEGNIPEEIGLLKGLSTLNLSDNRFSSVIPQSIGSMNGLESLDLSFNKLTGLIPYSLPSLNSLERLNLSYNNLSGTIPRGPHFDTLSGDGSAYLNNSLLCGFYTNNTCEADQRTDATDGNSPNEGHGDDKDKLLLYAIVSLGFAVGFWGLFFVLLLKKQKWWFPYWRLVDVVAVGVANCMWKN